MMVIFLLSTICDISLYMIFANLAVHALFESVIATFAPLIVMPLVAGCAYLLHNYHPRLRFLPLPMMLLCFYPVRSLVAVLLLLVPCAYVTVIVFFKRFRFNAEQLRERIKICVIIILVPLITLLFRGYDYLESSYYFQHLLIYICCALCIFRITRVNSAVFTSRFLIINLSPVICGFIALTVLNSMRVFAAIWQGLGFIFTRLIVPLVKLFINILEWLASKIRYSTVVAPDVEFPAAVRKELLEVSGTLEATPLPLIIQLIIVILLISFAVFAVRKLMISHRRKYAVNGAFEIRASVAPITEETLSTGMRDFFTPKDPRMAVRYHYRRFLRMCAERGCPPKKGDTSKDINVKNKTSFSFESITRLRELYIKARYSEHTIQSSESKEAGELVKCLQTGSGSLLK